MNRSCITLQKNEASVNNPSIFTEYWDTFSKGRALLTTQIVAEVYIKAIAASI
jgi:hypothetical protein